MSKPIGTKKGKQMAKNKGAVSLIQGVNLPVETQEAQAEDAANSAAEQHEKAVEAAMETAIKFVESTAQFNSWLNSNAAVNNEAYARAQAAAIKRVTQDVDAEAAELRAKLAQLEAQKAKAASAFGMPVPVAAASKGKRGRKAKGTSDELPNESDIIDAVRALGDDNSSMEVGANIPNLMKHLSVADGMKSRFQQKIAKMREEKKLGDNGGSKRSLRLIVP